MTVKAVYYNEIIILKFCKFSDERQKRGNFNKTEYIKCFR